MALPLKYNVRNVLVRWRTTLFTVLGIGAVVLVFLGLRALARGIESTNANTGDPKNLLVVRKGSQAESGSLVTRDQFRTLRDLPGIARNEKGEPVVSAELVMIVSAPRREGNGEANTLIRGVTPRGMELRPQVKLIEGRWFQPGKREDTHHLRASTVGTESTPLGPILRIATAVGMLVSWMASCAEGRMRRVVHEFPFCTWMTRQRALGIEDVHQHTTCLLYTSPSPRD